MSETAASAWRDPATFFASRPGERIALTSGLLIGGGILAVRMLSMMGSLHAVTQTYDGIYHLNAVRLILDSGSASAWTVGSLATEPDAASFYPSAWHQTVSIVAMLTGGDIVLATDAVVLIMAAIVWPLSIAAFVRLCTATGALGLFAAGVPSSVALAFPMATSAFGVLLPFTLSLVLVPLGAILAVRVLGLAPPEGASRLPIDRAVLLIPPTAIAIASAHPRGVITLMVTGTVLAIWALCEHLWNRLVHAGGARPIAIAGSLALVALAIGPIIWGTFRPSRSSSP